VHLMGSLGKKSRADHARNDDPYPHPLRTMLSSQAG